jgi:protein-disulfide isomerase
MTFEQNNSAIHSEGEKPKNSPRQDDVIVLSQSTVYYFLTALVFFVAGFSVSWVVSAARNDTALRELSDMKGAVASAASEAVKSALANGGSIAQAQPQPTARPPQDIVLGNSPVWGPENAKVTIVEFTDFQCPFCERFYSDTYTLIRRNYKDQVRFVFKHYPISSLHPDAMNAHLASECAREQGKFWEYHDIMFENQINLSRASLITYATTVGVQNADQFATCLDTQKYQSVVDSDLQAGSGYGVGGTPTFFINGTFVEGAQPYRVFEAAINQALAQAGS